MTGGTDEAGREAAEADEKRPMTAGADEAGQINATVRMILIMIYSSYRISAWKGMETRLLPD